MDAYENVLAHYDKDEPDNKQYLIEHLLTVSSLAGILGESVHLSNSSKLIGLLHDIGKNKEKFQLYIRGEYKGRVDHSSAGAMMIEVIAQRVYKDYELEDLIIGRKINKKTWELYKEILQYPILAHHGLYDIIDNDFSYRTGKRLDINKSDNNDKENIVFLEVLNKKYIALNIDSIYDLYYKGFNEFIEIYKRIKLLAPRVDNLSSKEEERIRSKSLHFYYGALVRLLLSILKDADIYDSSNFFRTDKDKTYSREEMDIIWDEMGESIESLYKEFNEKTYKTDLDVIRTNLANEIYEFSQKYGKGAYKLDMPVGSGKTYAGLRYAIGNAKLFKKKRIFYCTAFLSVLEQNADSIRQVVGDKYLLEHHSNIIEDIEQKEEVEDQKDYKINEYLKESWESPIVLTSVVQLSNTLFKHKSSNIRRFSKLINSVLIIDEIQSLPAKAIFNFNLMTNFLAEIMNCSIVHSTATPPKLDDRDALKYPCKYGSGIGNTSIIKTTDKSEVFSRVEYYSLLGESFDRVFNSHELTEHIKNQLECEKSVLIILNTKKAVFNLYNELVEKYRFAESKVEVVYLTTNLCPRHRLEIIKNIKESLKGLRNHAERKKIICVSTKLVEAGVDIDFDIVYRSLAGIDSVIQCGGRCNREGKKSSKGKLFICKYEDENLKYLPDIQKQIVASEAALKIELKEKDKAGRINIENVCDNYFHKLYLNEEVAGNYLSFPIKGDDENILNLLTSNPNLSANYRNYNNKKANFQLKQSFKTAALEFDLIKENTISAIVQYENEEIIDKLYEAIEIDDYYTIKTQLQKLQQYTISIRRAAEYENYIVKELEGEILILSKEAYDEKTGLVKGELEPLVF